MVTGTNADQLTACQVAILDTLGDFDAVTQYQALSSVLGVLIGGTTGPTSGPEPLMFRLFEMQLRIARRTHQQIHKK